MIWIFKVKYLFLLWKNEVKQRFLVMKNEVRYFNRIIDRELSEWVSDKKHKPILLCGTRQVGKSSAVRALGSGFDNFPEINFENKDNALVFAVQWKASANFKT